MQDLSVEALAPIDSFRGEFAWLSNMYSCVCIHEKQVFSSSEVLYQWLKTAPGWWRDRIKESAHGKVAKALAANPKCPRAPHADWIDFRIECMRAALQSKYQNNPDLRKALVATGDRELIEGNHWRDHFWGVCDDRGDNHLGRLHMEFRANFARQN